MEEKLSTSATFREDAYSVRVKKSINGAILQYESMSIDSDLMLIVQGCSMGCLIETPVI